MNNLAQYLAYTQPRSGQSQISPLAMQLINQRVTSPWQALGNVALMAADKYRSGKDTEERASSIAQLLGGAANQPLTQAGAGGMLPGGGATSGGEGPSNPEFGRIRDLLIQSPELMPYFQAQAMEKQFPDLFGEEQQLVEVTNADGSTSLVPQKAGLQTSPPPKVSPGNWSFNNNTQQYERTNPQTGELETMPGPAGGGVDPLFNVGGADPMQAISQNETAGNPNAPEMTSPKGAVGQYQIMPATGREIAQELGDKYALSLNDFDFERYLRDPQVNAQYGKHYYDKQLAAFKDPTLAAAAYNAGPGAVGGALQASGGNVGEAIKRLPEETQGYVGKFNAQTGGAGTPPYPGKPSDLSDKENEANARWLSDYFAAHPGEQPNPKQKAYIDTYLRAKSTDFEAQLARYNELDAKHLTDPASLTPAERTERKALRKKLALGSSYTGTETQSRFLVGAQALDNATAQMDALLATGYRPDGLAQVLSGLQGTGEDLFASVANAGLSAEDQMFFQILYQISDGANRPVSGAAINKEDLKNSYRQFVPLAGDDERTIKRKRDALFARSNTFYVAAGIDDEEREELRAKAANVEAPPLPTSAQPATGDPKPGDIEDGHRFKGGDPADPKNWEPVQ